MAHPLLWLAGFLALDKINQQSREIAECRRHLQRLGHGSYTENDAIVESSSDGCVGMAFLLFFVVPLCFYLIYLLFTTVVGLIILWLTGAVVIAFKQISKSVKFLLLIIWSGTALIFSAHSFWAVVFYWIVCAIIATVILMITKKK